MLKSSFSDRVSKINKTLFRGAKRKFETGVKMNKWGIPINIEEHVLKRDKKCVYCGCKFSDSIRKEKASWEHIINDIKNITIENIARCCVGCNASKGSKSLKDWFSSKYCLSKKINQETVSEAVRAHIEKYWG